MTQLYRCEYTCMDAFIDAEPYREIVLINADSYGSAATQLENYVGHDHLIDMHLEELEEGPLVLDENFLKSIKYEIG